MGNASQYKFNSWVVVGENSLTTQNIGVFTQPRSFSDARRNFLDVRNVPGADVSPGALNVGYRESRGSE